MLHIKFFPRIDGNEVVIDRKFSYSKPQSRGILITHSGACAAPYRCIVTVIFSSHDFPTFSPSLFSSRNTIDLRGHSALSCCMYIHLKRRSSSLTAARNHIQNQSCQMQSDASVVVVINRWVTRIRTFISQILDLIQLQARINYNTD